MEGLVKGLMNAALDAVAGEEDEDAAAAARMQSSPAEERSRSTWAEVASRFTRRLFLLFRCCFCFVIRNGDCWMCVRQVVSSGHEEEHERVPESDCGYGRNLRVARKVSCFLNPCILSV